MVNLISETDIIFCLALCTNIRNGDVTFINNKPIINLSENLIHSN